MHFSMNKKTKPARGAWQVFLFVVHRYGQVERKQVCAAKVVFSYGKQPL